MRNKGLISVLIGAVIFGVLAATAVSGYLRNVRESTLPNAMVVAKVDIPLGAKITPEHVTTVNVPKAATPDGAFTQIDQVLGRVTTTRVSAREPLTASRLAGVGAASGLSAVIPEGYRAMAISVDDETGIAGFLTPGTLVDVLAVLNTEQQHGAISKIVLQKIKVLANGSSMEQPGKEQGISGRPTVTLQVTPEQAEKLALAAAEGRLRLALRNAVDNGGEETDGVTKQTILGARALAPAPTPALPMARSDATLTSVRKTPPYLSRRSTAMSDWDIKRSAPQPVATLPAPPTNTASHTSIEVIEGGKKRTVVLP